MQDFFADPKCEKFVATAKAITEAAAKQCPDVLIPAVEGLTQLTEQVEWSVEEAKNHTSTQN